MPTATHTVILKLIAVATALLPAIATSQTMPHYAVTKRVALGAPDRWDYVTFDAASHRVFVAHGDRITVVEARDGSIIGDVGGFSGGTHGIAISNTAGRGYTDDGRAGEAGSFDLKTLAPQRRIRAGDDADAVVIDSRSGHVFVVNGDSGTMTVIDPISDRAIATVDVGGKLEFAVSDGAGKLYVNGAERGEIVRLDTATNRIDARWPIPMCTKPHGLAIDAATHRLFSSCVNSVLVVVNADTGAVLATLPIGRGTDAAAFDPRRHLIFSSNGVDGTLSVIREEDAQTFIALESIPTAVTARTMSLDPESGRIFLVAGELAADAGSSGAAAQRKSIVPGSLKLLFLDPIP
jgi:YVTN family beta-propeller protein